MINAEFIELGKNSFSDIESLLVNSGLIGGKFADRVTDSLEKLKYDFKRNKLKVFVKYNLQEVVAFVVLTTKTSMLSKLQYDLHIAYLYVNPSYRRQGWGEKILNHVIDYSSNTKANELSLYTTNDNIPAVEMYRKAGFDESNYLSNYLSFKINLKYIKNKRAGF